MRIKKKVSKRSILSGRILDESSRTGCIGYKTTIDKSVHKRITTTVTATKSNKSN